jgi:hypothetical protein
LTALYGPELTGRREGKKVPGLKELPQPKIPLLTFLSSCSIPEP